MQSIGKYEIVGELGKGGFGTVYRGRDSVLKRLVAIKVCSDDSANIRARFQREAEIVASLQHPNITTVYDLGVHDGAPYLVQELLSGEDLSGPIERREAMSLDRKLAILADVARGLEHAHANGIIHRDIKPGNIRLLADGSVKVMDFGIAKLANLETKLTKTGMMVGTAAYLAPEQIDDVEIDARCDIFSYGVLAYELLSYQRPFDASTISALLFQILHRPHLPLLGRNPDCPPTLAALVDRCLEKDREKRPQTFSDVRAQLADLGAGSGAIPRPSAIGATSTSAVRPPSGSSARPPLGEGETALAPRSVHAAQTRAYESGSTPLMPASSQGPAREAVPDIPTIPLASVPEFARRVTPPPPRRSRAPEITFAIALVAVIGAAAWYWLAVRGGAPPEREPAALVEPAEQEPPAAGATTPLPSSATAIPAPEATAGAPDTAGGGTTAEVRESPPTTRPSTNPAPTSPAGRPAAPLSRPAETATTPSRPAPAASTPPPEVESRPAPSTRPVVEPEPVVAQPPPAAAPAPEPQRPRTPTNSEAAQPSPSPSSVPATTSQPPAASPAKQPAPAPIDHEPAIRRALDRYRQAYENLNPGLLAEVWPSLGRDELERIERSFHSFDSVQVTIEGCQIDVGDSRATAKCRVRRTQKPKAGRVQTVEQETTFRLVQRGEEWVIEGL